MMKMRTKRRGCGVRTRICPSGLDLELILNTGSSLMLSIEGENHGPLPIHIKRNQIFHQFHQISQTSPFSTPSPNGENGESGENGEIGENW